MAKSQQSWNKKEREKKKIKERQDKAEKMQERKAGGAGTKRMEDMMAYVDENGNLVDAPPDPTKRKEVNLEDIVIGVRKQEDEDPAEAFRTGVVTFFNESKGYGFIRDLKTQESIFVHVNGLTEAVRENSKVAFETERGPKGLNAVRVKLAN
jgi:cold shock CspA family protein